jgi:integrase
MVITTMQQLESSLKSPSTSKAYYYALKYYLDYRKLSNLEELLANTTAAVIVNTKVIESQIVDYLTYLKLEKKTSYAYRSLQLAAIKHFYRMNDIELNWLKISKYMGEQIKVVRDRAYTTEEIQQILLKADERMRVIILLLASTGMRIGAIPSLKIRGIAKIEELDIYKITVYEGSSQDEYFTFCTPECANAIDSYLAYRTRSREQINPNSPLIREQFNTGDSFKISNPKALTLNTIKNQLRLLLIRSGVASATPDTGSNSRGRERKGVARAHGFRKFVTTNMIRAKVNPEAREMLLGHSIGLNDSYYRPDANEILTEYLKAVDLLTINEENRLKQKVEKLSSEADQIKIMREQIAQLQKQYTMQYELSLKYATEISYWSGKLAKERKERGHSAEDQKKLKNEEKERMRSYSEFLKLEKGEKEIS